MTRSQAFFRDVPGAATGPTPAGTRTVVASRRMGKVHHWSHVIHKWAGLFAAVWLAVLGLTGFFLDHESWRWQNQITAPSWLTPDALETNAKTGLFRLYQVDPQTQANRIAGGPRGLWFSRDGGASWGATQFLDGDHPQILAIEPDPALGWRRLWLATDNGLYRTEDSGASARPAALSGDSVTALSAGAAPDEMLGVIDHARPFRFQTENPGQIARIALAPPEVLARPPEVRLNRFLHELHFGRGLFDRASSRLLNDVGGLGMFVLALTGLLYWALPKIWKARARHKDRKQTARATKKATIRWLFRIHSATLGIVAAVLAIYLSISGALIGHGHELGDFMRNTRLAQKFLPPAFGPSSWDGVIESVAAVPGQPEALILGSRLGLFSSADAGKSWSVVKNAEGQAIAAGLHIRRIEDKLLVANSMSAPSLIRDADAATHEVAGRAGGDKGARHEGHHAGDDGGKAAVHGSRQDHAPDGGGANHGEERGGMFMPVDATRIGDRLAWKNGAKLVVTDLRGQTLESQAIHLPDAPGVPLYTWFRRLHTGAIFWSQWRWVNDIFALAALTLAITGLIRWERKKWA